MIGKYKIDLQRLVLEKRRWNMNSENGVQRTLMMKPKIYSSTLKPEHLKLPQLLGN